MSYFPEYYGGEMWSRALSNMGDNIAGAIEFYHKRHQENIATDAELGYLHDSGAIDAKAWERVTHARAGDKMAVEQGMLDAYKMKQQNDLHQAQLAHIKAETEHLTNPKLTPYQEAALGLRRNTKEAREFAARQKGLDAALKNIGINRVSLFDSSIHQGVALEEQKDKTGKVTGVATKQVPPDKATHIRVGYKDEQTPGHTIPIGAFNTYQQIAAASTANPRKTLQAWKWLQEHPNDSRAPKWREWLKQQILAASVAQGVDTGEDTGDQTDQDAGEPNNE